jgi:preprotein translocase subunit Sec63
MSTPADTAPVPGTVYDVGLSRDGERIKDPSYYQLFGLKGDATDEQIKKSYRKLALRAHPDRNPGDAEAAAKFQEISEAYT